MLLQAFDDALGQHYVGATFHGYLGLNINSGDYQFTVETLEPHGLAAICLNSGSRDLPRAKKANKIQASKEATYRSSGSNSCLVPGNSREDRL